jgi:hypothetical protein
MKYFLPLLSLLAMTASPRLSAQPGAPTPSYPRPLIELYTSYFPLHEIGEITPATWAARRQEIRERVLLAAGLFPLPTKTPLNAVVHGRVERDDYTIDRVFFESFPGHYVTGNLYLPKTPPPGGRMPGILSPHGHWTNGRFMDVGEKPADMKQQLAIGAERWESGARSPLHARCVQLARMGCAVFFYDMLGYADSVQIRDHRSNRRPELNGKTPGTFGLSSPMADLRLQSNFGLQTWNSLRALDFLLTVAGVDPSRLAITGESGGGTQTLMLAAIDDRLAAAFPCVMTSTAMQGGCTCENACYLRINQGNIDIAAAFAPKPMGMTAANDWTKELEKKGFPDLKRVWTKLGRPDNVMATFNVHWLHNYNHVSRTTMYGFVNQHFKLGLGTPVLEREFVVPTTAELTVWTGAYPKPSDDKVGPAHEKALLKHWSDDSDRRLAKNDPLNRRAWEIMVGRKTPAPADVKVDARAPEDAAGFTVTRGTVHNLKHDEEVPFVRLEPKARGASDTVVLWLSTPGTEGLLAEGNRLSAAAQKLIDGGVTIVCPTLYLEGANEQPRNPVKSRDPQRNDWQWSACYTYGYNHPLVMHRVHDAMTILASLKPAGRESAGRIILAGRAEGGVVAAITAVVQPQAVTGAVIDTGGFRFAALDDQWHPLFVPGAVKYGDVPELIRLCAPLQPTVLGENNDGGTEAVAAAILAHNRKRS